MGTAATELSDPLATILGERPAIAFRTPRADLGESVTWAA